MTSYNIHQLIRQHSLAHDSELEGKLSHNLVSMRFIVENQWYVKIKSNIQSSNMYFSSSYV